MNIIPKRSNFRFAFQGLIYLLKKERNFRFHTLVTLIVVLVGFLLNIAAMEWIMILLCIGLVLALEAINTAIELIADLITKEQNEQIGRIKDIAAGAVLIASILSVLVGLIIFLPKIIDLF